MHPIIALWSHPRSMSTATERIMRERGDLSCFHEPFMYMYYIEDGKKEMPHFDADSDTPTTYADIKKALLKAAESGPVFFKDMSYYIYDRLSQDREFFDQIIHTFLIRDPAKSIVSYYKLDPNVTSEEIGLESQAKHANWYKETYGKDPIVIEAADIQENAAGIMKSYCAAVGLEFLPHALEWSQEPPKEWQGVSGWHGDVMSAGGIKKDSDTSDNKEQSVSKVTLDSAPHLREYYDHHITYFKELQSYKLKPQN